MPSLSRISLCYLALAGVSLLIYGPALSGGFLWDDTDWIRDNETLRTAGGLWRIWFEPGAVIQYYPLTYTSWWLDCQLWGLSPAVMHVENVLLHAANALLFGLLLRRLLLPGAWIAAVIFLVHPVHAESVAWLQGYLQKYPGCVILVTHDRCFLDELAEWVLELDRGAGLDMLASDSPADDGYGLLPVRKSKGECMTVFPRRASRGDREESSSHVAAKQWLLSTQAGPAAEHPARLRPGRRAAALLVLRGRALLRGDGRDDDRLRHLCAPDGGGQDLHALCGANASLTSVERRPRRCFIAIFGICWFGFILRVAALRAATLVEETSSP